jgi:mycothiol synthase
VSPASTVARVPRVDFSTTVTTDVLRIAAAATTADGATPLDEATTLALHDASAPDTALWVDNAHTGFAWLHDGALDLVVHPDARGHGVGRALADAAVTSTDEPLTAWSHGHHPAAAVLADRLGFAHVRDLWVMRRPLADLPPLPEAADGIDVRAFRVGQDEDAWLAVNAEAFAHHPEQGGTTRADLDARIAEPWFDPAGFLLAWRGDELAGFHWTKVHGEATGEEAYGEVYVVGVSPRAQGGGLGKRLTLAGLHHLAGLGLAEVVLYVEADNAPAIAVYERLGFTHAACDTHVQYARR